MATSGRCRNYSSFILILLCLCSWNLQAQGNKVTFNADVINVTNPSSGQRILLEGRAFVQSDQFKVTADRIEIVGNDFSNITATGRGFLVVKNGGNEIRAQKLTYNQKNSKMTASGDVSYRGADQMEIRCQFLEQEKQGIYNMRGLVRLMKDSLFARADSAIYQESAFLLQLLGDATIYRGNDRFSATRISINTKTEEIVMNGTVEGEVTKQDGTN